MKVLGVLKRNLPVILISTLLILVCTGAYLVAALLNVKPEDCVTLNIDMGCPLTFFTVHIYLTDEIANTYWFDPLALINDWLNCFIGVKIVSVIGNYLKRYIQRRKI